MKNNPGFIMYGTTGAGAEFIAAQCEFYSSGESEMVDVNVDGILNLSDMKRSKLDL